MISLPRTQRQVSRGNQPGGAGSPSDTGSRSVQGSKPGSCLDHSKTAIGPAAPGPPSHSTNLHVSGAVGKMPLFTQFDFTVCELYLDYQRHTADARSELISGSGMLIAPFNLWHYEVHLLAPSLHQ